MSKHPCEGCVDAAKNYAGVGGYICEYFDHTGHPRSLICPPREECTVKSRTPRPECAARYAMLGVGSASHAGQKEKINPREVRRMAALGYNDRDIAKAVEVSVQAVWACRKRHNIPSGAKQRKKEGCA